MQNKCRMFQCCECKICRWLCRIAENPLKTKSGHLVSISIVLIQPDRFIEISIRRVIVVFINCLEDDFSANSTHIHFIYHSHTSINGQVNRIWILILLIGSQTGIRKSSLMIRAFDVHVFLVLF